MLSAARYTYTTYITLWESIFLFNPNHKKKLNCRRLVQKSDNSLILILLRSARSTRCSSLCSSSTLKNNLCVDSPPINLVMNSRLCCWRDDRPRSDDDYGPKCTQLSSRLAGKGKLFQQQHEQQTAKGGPLTWLASQCQTRLRCCCCYYVCLRDRKNAIENGAINHRRKWRRLSFSTYTALFLEIISCIIPLKQADFFRQAGSWFLMKKPLARDFLWR